METVMEVKYLNTSLTHEQMLEKFIGKNIIESYYSVFNQFQEEEFQEMTRYYDEWFQVYTSDNESEPLYNVYFIDFKDGSLMMVEYF